MSFSSCIVCKQMVGMYQKYCNACLVRSNVKQDEDWGKISHGSVDPLIEVIKDKKSNEIKVPDFIKKSGRPSGF